MSDDIAHALGSIMSFGRGANIETVRIVQCDTAVTSDEIVMIDDLATYRVSGFGGSDMTPAMLHLANDPETVVVVITDGEIGYPAESMPYFVLWVVYAVIPLPSVHARLRPGDPYPPRRHLKLHIRPRIVADCGISSTEINPLGALHTQSIALTTRAAVEMQPASVESRTGWETWVLISTRGSPSTTTRCTPVYPSGGNSQSGAAAAVNS